MAVGLRSTNKPVGVLVAAGKHAFDLVGFTSDVDPAVNATFSIQSFYALDPWRASWGNPGLGSGYPVSPNTQIAIAYWNSTYFLKYSQTGDTYWNGNYVVVLRSSKAEAPSSNPAPPYDTTKFGTSAVVSTAAQLGEATIEGAVRRMTQTKGETFGSSLGLDLRALSVGQSVHVSSAIAEHPSYYLTELKQDSNVMALALIVEDPDGLRVGAIRGVLPGYRLPSESGALATLEGAGHRVSSVNLTWGWSSQSMSPFVPLWVGTDQSGATVSLRVDGEIGSGLQIAPGFTARPQP